MTEWFSCSTESFIAGNIIGGILVLIFSWGWGYQAGRWSILNEKKRRR